MYLDMTYIVLVLPAVILSLWASWNVKRTFKKYAKVENSRGLTGADAARRVLDANGLRDIPVSFKAAGPEGRTDSSTDVFRHRSQRAHRLHSIAEDVRG